jgi:hypothetical protein
MAMRLEPTSEQIQTAVSAGNVFSSRAELIEFAKQLEGFDFDSYNGVWAFWNGNIVGAVASDQYSKSLQTAVIEEGQCSQRADQIMEAANTLESAGNEPAPNSLQDRADGGACVRPKCPSVSHEYCDTYNFCGACLTRDHRCI